MKRLISLLLVLATVMSIVPAPAFAEEEAPAESAAAAEEAKAEPTPKPAEKPAAKEEPAPVAEPAAEPKQEAAVKEEPKAETPAEEPAKEEPEPAAAPEKTEEPEEPETPSPAPAEEPEEEQTAEAPAAPEAPAAEKAPVSIAVKPLKDVRLENGSAEFTVTAEASDGSKLSYQWEVLDDSVDYEDDAARAEAWQELKGETKKALVFENTEYAAVKDLLYRCRISAADAVVFTAEVKLLEEKKAEAVEPAAEEPETEPTAAAVEATAEAAETDGEQNGVEASFAANRVMALAEEPLLAASSAYPVTGSCGAGLTWSLSSAGTLTVSGTGAMSFTSGAPWYDHADEVLQVVIGEGVTGIADMAFSSCTNLASVQLPATLKTIGDGAFDCCSKLKAVTLPAGLTSIGSVAFQATGISEIVFPASVTSIGASAFCYCQSLKKITFLGNAPEIGEYAFSHVTAAANCPAGDGTWTAAKKQNYGGTLTWNSTAAGSYQVKYALGGGVNDERNIAEYAAGSGTAPLYPATRTGYTFAGWYSDSAKTKKVTAVKLSVKKNQTFYAKWTANKYTVRFDPNGGTDTVTGTMKSLSCTYGTAKALTANAFKRSGYTFTGWEDANGNVFNNKASVKNLTAEKNGTVTLYARWKLTEYKITYTLNGGTNSGANPASYKKTDSDIVLQAPSRTGYDFAGWYTSSKFEAKNKVTEIKTAGVKNVTLYAKWTAHKYTVHFEGNGATSGTMKDLQCVYGTAKALTANAFKRAGYTFNGWETMDGTVYGNKASVKNLTESEGVCIALFARWKLNTYKITYTLNGGTNNAENPASYTVEDGTVTLKAAAKKGYTFAGWYTDSKLTKRLAFEGTGDSFDYSGAPKALTVYAKWTANTYYVRFDMNAEDAEGTMDYQKATYNKEAALTANAFTREDYRFVSWNTKPDGTGTTYKNKGKFKNLTSEDGNIVTLYAQWRVDSYERYNTIVLDFQRKTGYSNLKNQKQTYTIKNVSSKQSKIKDSSGKDIGYVPFEIGSCNVDAMITLLNRASLYYYNNSSNPFSMANVGNNTQTVQYRRRCVNQRNEGKVFKYGSYNVRTVQIVEDASTPAEKNTGDIRTGYLTGAEGSGPYSFTLNGQSYSLKKSQIKNSNGSLTWEVIREKLREHPEGIYFGYGHHYIVLTRYTQNADKTYTYYAIDPVYADKGEIALSKVYDAGSTKNIKEIKYVTPVN